MLNAEQATAAAQAIHYPASDEFNTKAERSAALAEYRAAHTAVTNEFRAYLEENYAWNHTAEQREKLWNAAWSEGHHSGYLNVQGYYDEYTDLTDEELEELEY